MSKLLAIADIVPGWVWAAVVAALLATSCMQRNAARADLATAQTETATARQELETERRQAADRARLEADAARKREQTLQDQADLARKADQDEIRRIAAARDRALSELQKRPARPAGAAAPGVPTAAGTGSTPAGCTGAQLYREDGEFLVREAARANVLRGALRSCIASYERARAVQQEMTTNAPAEPSH